LPTHTLNERAQQNRCSVGSSNMAEKQRRGSLPFLVERRSPSTGCCAVLYAKKRWMKLASGVAVRVDARSPPPFPEHRRLPPLLQRPSRTVATRFVKTGPKVFAHVAVHSRGGNLSIAGRHHAREPTVRDEHSNSDDGF
ncbi:unnamed protein product, partial [Ixodes persulcatus]